MSTALVDLKITRESCILFPEKLQVTFGAFIHVAIPTLLPMGLNYSVS